MPFPFHIMSLGLRCSFLFFLPLLCHVVHPECVTRGEETQQDKDWEHYVAHGTFPDRPCVWKGVTLGAVREGYECINLRYMLNEQMDPDDLTLFDADWDVESGLSAARRVLWQKLKKSDGSIQVRCQLTHGVVFIMNDWSTAQCAQARSDYERCINTNLTPRECLGKAIMTPPWEP